MTPALALNTLLQMQQKVSDALSLLQEIEQGTFPHNDSKIAVHDLATHFSKEETTLKSAAAAVEAQPPETPLSAAVQKLTTQACRRSAEALETLLPVIGFLLRSTNVRTAFEMYGPLLRLARRTISPDVHLVVSSEWEYSPFTYPSTIPELPNFVFIGLPASESGNGLILPAAGHELGHSIWNTQKIGQQLIPKIRDAIIEKIRTKWSRFSILFPGVQEENFTDLINAPTWDFSVEWCVAQCSELFCDFCGILLFGRGYLRTFSYLLAPNLGGARIEVYPAMRKRAVNMMAAAKELAVPVTPTFADAFVDEEVRLDDRAAFLLEIADETTQETVKQLIEEVLRIQNQLSIKTHEPQEEAKAVVAFQNLMPAQGITNLSSVINAAWDSQSNPSLWPAIPELRERQSEIVNDLLLKTLEVIEYDAILSESDAPKN